MPSPVVLPFRADPAATIFAVGLEDHPAAHKSSTAIHWSRPGMSPLGAQGGEAAVAGGREARSRRPRVRVAGASGWPSAA